MEVSSLTLLDNEVVVIWEYEWEAGNESNNNSLCEYKPSDRESSPSNGEDSSPEDDVMVCSLHTITFKVIGCTKDQFYQDTLRAAQDIRDRREHVDVNLFPEPSNRYDPNAVAFKCNVAGKWQVIGYVVKEISEK